MALPRDYVEGPSFTPLPHGLLSALASEIRTPIDTHWEGGVTYETLCGAGDSTYDECFAVSGVGAVATPAPPAAKSYTASIDKRGATSFTVYAEVDCSAPGFWDRAEESAEDALRQSEQYQVEYALWTGRANGATVVFPHLAASTAIVDDNGYTLQTAAVLVTGGNVLDVVEALGRVEGELASCYNGVGVIHVPRALAATFQNASLIIPDGTRYRTVNGNIVVFGSGYTGSSPKGVSDTSLMWIYATGMPFIYRSPVRIFRSKTILDRATNTMYAIAERTYVIGWNCCHIGASVTLGGIPAGASGTPGAFGDTKDS